MKLETLPPPAHPDAVALAATEPTAWRVALPLLVLALTAVLAIYWRTAESIVDIWSRSETFAHAWLIVPISLYLIWARRRELAKLVPSADWLGLVLLAGSGLAWLVAAAGQVQIVQQYALVTMIPATVIAVAGRHVARAMAFPLGFLFLGVPIGEALIPPLMDWTADFTTTALRLTGIPVFREGNFFTIPSGSWSVVEGCSGLRYLIASITVGTLYAYLNYRRLRTRAVFVALSVIVPILANGLRAYMIVMIGHLSDGRLAHGVDHLIYGWVFFGVVMLLLFWLGSYWQDDVEPVDAGRTAAVAAPVPAPSRGRMGASALGAMALAAVWPLYAAHLDRTLDAGLSASLEAPPGVQGWAPEAEQLTGWRPRYAGAAASVAQTYRKGDRSVLLYLGFYRGQRQGAGLVTSTNIMIEQKHPVWSNVGEAGRTENVGHGSQDLRQTLLRSLGQRLLVWDWFRISGEDLTNRYRAKLLLARDRLLDRGDDAVAIIVATDYSENTDVAAETLRQFVREMGPSIDATLARAAGGGAAAR